MDGGKRKEVGFQGDSCAFLWRREGALRVILALAKPVIR